MVSYVSLIGPLIFGALVALTLVAPRRPRFLAYLAFRVAAVYNEAPFPIIYLIVLFAPDGFASGGSGSWVIPLLNALVILGLLVIAWRGARERPVVERALLDGLGENWRDRIDNDQVRGLRSRPPLARILLMPFVTRPANVHRIANVAYGGAGKRNLLDVYHRKDLPEGAPVIVHFHGGGYYSGRKSFESRALLFRLASAGWVAISANYRLRPQGSFADHLHDAKRVIAWVRDHGADYGADPSTLFLVGGSAGAHLSSIAALTQNDPRYQPGFEDADTSVTAVACLYGWFGGYYEIGGPYSEAGVLGHAADDAPPFMIAHGTEDTLAGIESARAFADHLRKSSPNPVVFAELPHGQHAFDLFHSFRYSAVVDGIEAFAAWVRAQASSKRIGR
jgi:acetyl esterase/lipase